MSSLASSRSTSASDSVLPSMRVDEPMLSIVATRRRAERRSGARVPRARYAPLNSSISATRFRRSGVICSVSVLKPMPIFIPINIHNGSVLLDRKRFQYILAQPFSYAAVCSSCVWVASLLATLPERRVCGVKGQGRASAVRAGLDQRGRERPPDLLWCFFYWLGLAGNRPGIQRAARDAGKARRSGPCLLFVERTSRSSSAV